MNMGGTFFEKQTLSVMKLIGILAPLMFFVYGWFVVGDLVPSDNFQSVGIFLLLSLSWIAFGIYQYIQPPVSRAGMAFNISLYHLFATLYILFVSGFTTPFVGAWALLYLASYVYFSYIGVATSVAWFLLMLVIDTFAFNQEHQSNIIINISACFATILIGGAAIALNRIKEFDQAALAQTRRDEALQRDRMYTLVNNLTDAIFSIDRNGVIAVHNAASLNLLDTNSELNGKSIDEVLHLYDNENKLVKLLPLVKKAKAVVIDDSLTTKISDEIIRLEITYSPIRSSFDRRSSHRLDGYVIIIRDITKEKSLEEERDEFISVVSHELRTPIAITEGAIDNSRLMFERAPDRREEVTKSLTTAHEQVIFLSKMVNDLSTLSRAERGIADAPEFIDVVELASDLYNEYVQEAEKKDLKLNLKINNDIGYVNASRLYLHELLQNFVTNAIKYTMKGHVNIVIHKNHDEVTFAVEDTGIGISRSDQVKIFQKFYRAEDYRTRETNGTGLGLYVAEKLSRKLGCMIELKSRLNHGSTFSFSLPSAQDTPLRANKTGPTT